MIAKTIYGEAQGIWSLTEQAAVAWTICNRADSTGYGMGKSIKYVVTFQDQFHGYSPYHPVYDDYGRDLRILAADVIIMWQMEKDGYDVMRVLPKEYKWFSGLDGHNVFRDELQGRQSVGMGTSIAIWELRKYHNETDFIQKGVAAMNTTQPRISEARYRSYDQKPPPP